MRDQQPERDEIREDQGRAAVVSLLRDLGDRESVEAIASMTVRTIFDTLPGYDEVSAESVRHSVRRNIAMSVRVLRRGAEPTADDLPEAEALASERLEAGVPLGSLLSGFRLCLTSILGRLLELAPERGVPAETALGFSTTLWSLGDVFTARAMLVYQDRAVAEAVSDSARRTQWTIDAVARGLPAEELQAGLAEFGVPKSSELRAFRLTGTDGSDRELDAPAPLPDGNRIVASAPYAGGVLGIAAPTNADPAPSTAAVAGSERAAHLARGRRSLPGDLSAHQEQRLALGPAVAAEELPSSYAAALQIHEAAAAVGWRGVVDLRKLSWRMAVTGNPETTRMLRSRWLGPLEDEGEFAEHLLEAVSAYLSHGLNIPRAAASIPVHANTLRYRLRRFADLTGGDLESIDAVVELSWVLAPRMGETSPL